MVGKKVANRDRSTSKAERIRGLGRYMRNPETPGGSEKCVYAGARGFFATTEDGQLEEMTALAERAPRSRDPIVHYVLSWREGERPSREQVEEAVDVLAREQGLQGHQMIYALHADTDNWHVHVMVNRVHPETERATKAGGGFDIRALHRACARIERMQGWQPERNARYSVDASGTVRETDDAEQSPSKVPQARVDTERRTGEASVTRVAAQTAGPIIENAKSWEQLHRALARHDMRYTRKGSGAVVQVGDVFVKASSVRRTATLSRLEKRLGPYVGAADGATGAQRPSEQPDARDEESAVRESADPKRAWPLIRKARTWRELHVGLAQHGMRYVKSGSGASIFAGKHDAVSMTASAVARRASLRSLEARLGPYVADRWSTARDAVAEPLEGQMPRWREYTGARGESEERSMLMWARFTRRCDDEEKRLEGAQDREREELARSRTWEGCIAALHVARSLLAAMHASQRAELREQQRRRREALRAACRTSPDYAAWIDDVELALLWRSRHRLHCAIEPAPSARPDIGQRARGDIRDYQAREVDGWVLYTTPSHRARGEVAFVDRGECITLHDGAREASTLAALQLATAKWGAIVVTGDDAFKRRCARLAAEHGFTVVNPELQDAIRTHREALAEQARLDRDRSAQPGHGDAHLPRPAPAVPVPGGGGYGVW